MYKKIMKIVASLLVCIFTVESVYAQVPHAPKPDSGAGARYFLPVAISEKYGTVGDTWLEGKEGIVYLIEDAHTSLVAQNNIARIISDIVEGRREKIEGRKKQKERDGTTFHLPSPVYPLSSHFILCTEGYEGDLGKRIDDAFSGVSDPVSREKTAEFLMKNGEMTGAQYAYLKEGINLPLYGVEYEKTYQDNLAQFKEVLKQWQTIEPIIKDYRKKTVELKKKCYPSQILHLDKAHGQFLVNQDTAYIAELLSYAKKNNISLAPYPLIVRLAEQPQNGISDYVRLIDECDALFAAIKGKGLREDAGILNEFERSLQFIEKLFTATLTREEWECYGDKKKSFLEQFIMAEAWVSTHVTLESRLDADTFTQWYRHAYQFYRSAHTRDKYMAKNTYRQMKWNKTGHAILVAGGFHTEGLKRYLKEYDLSFVVIRPRIESIDNLLNALYFQKAAGGESAVVKSMTTLFTQSIPVANLFTEHVSEGLDLAFFIQMLSAFIGRDTATIESMAEKHKATLLLRCDDDAQRLTLVHRSTGKGIVYFVGTQGELRFQYIEEKEPRILSADEPYAAICHERKNLVSLSWDNTYQDFTQKYIETGFLDLRKTYMRSEDKRHLRVNSYSDYESMMNDEPVLVKIGNLLFIEPRFLGRLSRDLQEKLRANVMRVHQLGEREINTSHNNVYTTAVLFDMQDKHIEKCAFIDCGSGDGMLSLAALHMGSPTVDLIDSEEEALADAITLLQENGYEKDKDFFIHCGDLSDQEFMKKVGEEIHERLQKNHQKAALVTNIGTWPGLYSATNKTSFSLLQYIPEISLLLAGGNAEGDHNREIVEEDQKALEAMVRGFSVTAKPVYCAETEYILCWSAVRDTVYTADEARFVEIFSVYQKQGILSERGEVLLSKVQSNTAGASDISEIKRLLAFFDSVALKNRHQIFRSYPAEYFKTISLPEYTITGEVSLLLVDGCHNMCSHCPRQKKYTVESMPYPLLVQLAQYDFGFAFIEPNRFHYEPFYYRDASGILFHDVIKLFSKSRDAKGRLSFITHGVSTGAREEKLFEANMDRILASKERYQIFVSVHANDLDYERLRKDHTSDEEIIHYVTDRYFRQIKKMKKCDLVLLMNAIVPYGEEAVTRNEITKEIFNRLRKRLQKARIRYTLRDGDVHHILARRAFNQYSRNADWRTMYLDTINEQPFTSEKHTYVVDVHGNLQVLFAPCYSRVTMKTWDTLAPDEVAELVDAAMNDTGYLHVMQVIAMHVPYSLSDIMERFKDSLPQKKDRDLYEQLLREFSMQGWPIPITAKIISSKVFPKTVPEFHTVHVLNMYANNMLNSLARTGQKLQRTFDRTASWSGNMTYVKQAFIWETILPLELSNICGGGLMGGAAAAALFFVGHFFRVWEDSRSPDAEVRANKWHHFKKPSVWIFTFLTFVAGVTVSQFYLAVSALGILSVLHGIQNYHGSTLAVRHPEPLKHAQGEGSLDEQSFQISPEEIKAIKAHSIEEGWRTLEEYQKNRRRTHIIGWAIQGVLYAVIIYLGIHESLNYFFWGFPIALGTFVFALSVVSKDVKEEYLYRDALERDPQALHVSRGEGKTVRFKKATHEQNPPLEEGGIVYKEEPLCDPLTVRDILDLEIATPEILKELASHPLSDEDRAQSVGEDPESGATLFRYFERTRTIFGQKRLFRLMTKPIQEPEVIHERQKVVRFLMDSKNTVLRQKINSLLAFSDARGAYEAIMKKPPFRGAAVFYSVIFGVIGCACSTFSLVISMDPSLWRLWLLMVMPIIAFVIGSASFSSAHVPEYKAALTSFVRAGEDIVTLLDSNEEALSIPYLKEIYDVLRALKDKDHPYSIAREVKDHGLWGYGLLVKNKRSEMARIMGAIAELDAYLSISLNAIDHEMHALPTVLNQEVPYVRVTNGIYPLHVLQDGITPNSFEFRRDGDRIYIISGPNMAGKTTSEKMLALNLILAHMGSPVAVVDQGDVKGEMIFTPVKIRTHINVEDSLAEGLSKYDVETDRMLDHLNAALDSNTFLTLVADEMFDGTLNAGKVITQKAALRALNKKGVLGVVSVHEPELIEFADTEPGMKNVHFSERIEGDIAVRDYAMREGGISEDEVNFLDILKRKGFPQEVINDATAMWKEYRDPALRIATLMRKAGVSDELIATVIHEIRQNRHLRNTTISVSIMGVLWLGLRFLEWWSGINFSVGYESGVYAAIGGMGSLGRFDKNLEVSQRRALALRVLERHAAKEEAIPTYSPAQARRIIMEEPEFKTAFPLCTKDNLKDDLRYDKRFTTSKAFILMAQKPEKKVAFVPPPLSLSPSREKKARRNDLYGLLQLRGREWRVKHQDEAPYYTEDEAIALALQNADFMWQHPTATEEILRSDIREDQRFKKSRLFRMRRDNDALLNTSLTDEYEQHDIFGKRLLKVYDTRTGIVWEEYTYKKNGALDTVRLYSPRSEEYIVIKNMGEHNQQTEFVLNEDEGDGRGKKIGELYVSLFPPHQRKGILTLKEITIDVRYRNNGLGAPVIQWLALYAARNGWKLRIEKVRHLESMNIYKNLFKLNSLLVSQGGFRDDSECFSKQQFASMHELNVFLRTQPLTLKTMSEMEENPSEGFRIQGDKLVGDLLPEGYTYTVDADAVKVKVRDPKGELVSVRFNAYSAFYLEGNVDKNALIRARVYADTKAVPKERGNIVLYANPFGVIFSALWQIIRRAIKMFMRQNLEELQTEHELNMALLERDIYSLIGVERSNQDQIIDTYREMAQEKRVLPVGRINGYNTRNLSVGMKNEPEKKDHFTTWFEKNQDRMARRMKKRKVSEDDVLYFAAECYVRLMRNPMFHEGNNRTAFLLANNILFAAGLPMMRLTKENQAEYDVLRHMIRYPRRFYSLTVDTIQKAAHVRYMYAFMKKSVDPATILKKSYDEVGNGTDWNIDQFMRYMPVIAYIRNQYHDNPVVVEVGAGQNGGIVPYARNEFSVVSLDLEKVRQRPFIQQIVGDVSALPIQTEVGDVVLCLDVLEHIPHSLRKDAIRAMYSTVKAGGTLVIGVPVGKRAQAVETIVQGMYRVFTGRNYKWLEEHTFYGLPTLHELDDFFNNEHWTYIAHENVSLFIWPFILGLSAILSKVPPYMRTNITQLVYRLMAGFTWCGYRKIYYVTKPLKNISISEKHFETVLPEQDMVPSVKSAVSREAYRSPYTAIVTSEFNLPEHDNRQLDIILDYHAGEGENALLMQALTTYMQAKNDGDYHITFVIPYSLRQDEVGIREMKKVFGDRFSVCQSNKGESFSETVNKQMDGYKDYNEEYYYVIISDTYEHVSAVQAAENIRRVSGDVPLWGDYDVRSLLIVAFFNALFAVDDKNVLCGKERDENDVAGIFAHQSMMSLMENFAQESSRIRQEALVKRAA